MKDIHGGNIWGVSKELKKSPGEIIDFSASINPLGMSPKAAQAVKSALPLAGSYPDPDSAALKEALAARYSIGTDELLPANGSIQLIYLLPQVLRPKRALIVEPAFSEYASALKPSGCAMDRLILKERDGFALDLKALAGRLARNPADMVYIASPANPTGVATGRDALLEAASICRSAGSTLVVDEAFADFAEEESIIEEAPSLSNVIVLRSLTKFFSMAGLRLGFMVAGRRTIRAFEKQMPPWSINSLASAAAVASLADERYRRATMGWLATERPYLFDRLGKVQGLTPFASDANFFLVKIEAAGVDSLTLRARLLEDGIMIRELSAFRGLGKGFFRVAIRGRKENMRLIRSLKRAMAGF